MTFATMLEVHGVSYCRQRSSSHSFRWHVRLQKSWWNLDVWFWDTYVSGQANKQIDRQTDTLHIIRRTPTGGKVKITITN